MRVKKQGWINIYHRADIDGDYHDIDGPWGTEEKACIAANADIDLQDTIQIEWEEDV